MKNQNGALDLKKDAKEFYYFLVKLSELLFEGVCGGERYYLSKYVCSYIKDVLFMPE